MSSAQGARSKILNLVRKVVRAAGFDIVRFRKDPLTVLSRFYDDATIRTIRTVQPYTMTSPERIAAVCEATQYITRSNIPGAIVECGVWRGGSMMAIARTLLELGDTTRHLYLYDTFAGMTAPGADDITFWEEAASTLLQAAKKEDPSSIWCYATLEAVTNALFSVGYPRDKIHFVKGRVEETVPATAPSRIALLRLDTDWYESTRHELVHLFPRLAKGGVLIIDDYGHWKGARKAVDEYFANQATPLLLNRIDYSGRMAVKFD